MAKQVLMVRMSHLACSGCVANARRSVCATGLANAEARWNVWSYM
jgi:hypothetical protein